MSRRKPRNLSPEEKALWDSVASRATPMRPEKRAPTKLTQPEPEKPKPLAPKNPPLAPFKLGAKSKATPPGHSLKPSVPDHLSALPIQMDKKAFGRMKRGKLVPEDRIDLHGMTLAEAHPALTSFIFGSASAGLRLVLVITGKGKDRDHGGPIPERRGMLRHQVPQWLAMAPLAPLVLQVTPAHLKHGGLGAYYVYLRRRR